ncbi:hypothetical protein [Atlantibacter hermannii]|uniref:hypothetical protein n=1 Tax=Atlantibacter hermannii TaxID=565 RepID=UPI0028ABAAF1|nr:hypothetical protein [Atlantibacter hermannii]
MIWIPVRSANDIPPGEWLVTLKGGKVSTAKINMNIKIIGNAFHFDMPDVIAYMPCPAPYQELSDANRDDKDGRWSIRPGV